MEAGEGHVDDHQGVPHGPAHHLGMVDHLFQRHRQRGAVPLDDHRQAVADEDPLDAGGIDQPGHGVIVGGQHGDLSPGRFHGGELGHGDLLVLRDSWRLAPVETLGKLTTCLNMCAHPSYFRPKAAGATVAGAAPDGGKISENVLAKARTRGILEGTPKGSWNVLRKGTFPRSLPMLSRLLLAAVFLMGLSPSLPAQVNNRYPQRGRQALIPHNRAEIEGTIEDVMSGGFM